MKTFLLKLDDAIYKAWLAAAKRAGKSLSEWIREQCNKKGGR
jgi:predicted HicB family RNase H-like nuclease